MDKPPLQAIDFEEGILAGMLLHPETCAQAVELLKAEYFYPSKNQMLFAACKELYQAGKPVDLTTVADFLKDEGQLDNVGASYLAELPETAPVPSSVQHYADKIRDKYYLRMLKDVGVHLQKAVYDSGIDPAAVIQQTQESILDVESDIMAGPRYTWEDEGHVIDSFIESLKYEQPSIKTGFKELDSKIDGLIPGGLHVIQGDSSIGKTTFCKQLADQIHVEHPDMPIFFFALEDSLRTVRAMTLSRLSRVENSLIRKGGKYLDQRKMLSIKDARLTAKQIYGQDYYLMAGEVNITVRKIRSMVTQRLKAIGKTTALVIVDYLQILPTPKEERLGSLMDKIDFNLHELQCLARDIDGPVVLTSSTTKEDIKSTDKDRMPGKVKGKGSANILYTPRMLLELIEDDYEKDARKVTLHVIKHSEGSRYRTQSFNYFPQYSTFDEA